MTRRKTYSGDYNPDPDTESIEVIGRNEEEIRSILLHEVMHAVQTREGFAQGGNEMMGEDWTGLEGDAKAAEAAVKPLEEEWEAKAAKGDYDSKLAGKINETRGAVVRKARHQYYRRIAGEVEARNVQTRDEMRKKMKETGDEFYQPDAPWWTQDVPADKVVFTYSKNGTAFKVTETVDMFEGKREQFVIPGAEKITPAQRFVDSYKSPSGVSVEVAPYLDHPNVIALSNIERISGEKGAGAAAMRDLVAKADKAQVFVRLTVEKRNLEKLAPYYRQFGFSNVIKRDGDLLMQRAPEQGKMQPKKGQKSIGDLPLFSDQKDQMSLFSKSSGLDGYDAPRFKLGAAPAAQTQASQVMQGFIARGQPVDRALRVPFHLLGGIDSKGVWSPGKRLVDKVGPQGFQGAGMGAIIGGGLGSFGGPIGTAVGASVGATAGAYIANVSPSPTGKFRWMSSIAENGKRGLIDGYGLDEHYVEAYRRSEQGKAVILREAQGIMKVLSNAGVGTQEAQVLQQILTGEPINDAAMTRLAVPIRQAIDDLGAEAVSLGLISAESFQRNRGAYLHRVYAKNEIDQNTLAGWVSARMTNRRKKIIGDQLKGRGMFWDVPMDRLMRDVESFQSGARGAATLGEKFRVIDEVSLTPNLTPGGAPSEKTMRRVYLPAADPVPAKYQGATWVDRGTWEVRKAGKTNTLWRDYTKPERAKMGELVDARYTIAKTFMLMANDLSTGRFFKEVSEKAEWTKSTPPASPWKEGSEYSRFWNDPEIQWVKVPDTNISDTGGKKRWGALAGKWVRAEIWRDLNEVQVANNPGVWRTLLSQWKKNKTARNPVVHMNNVMSNLMLMDLADVRAQDLAAGIKAYATSSADFQEALDNGAFGSDMVAQELRNEVLAPILEEMTKATTGARNPFLARAGMLGSLADKIWTWAKAADNGMLRAYQMEDEIFRMAAYMRRRSQGESPQVAAMNARDQFLNYDIRAPWIVAMRNSVFPFISYTYRAVPKLMENIAHRPWKLAKYAAIAYAVNALAYMWDEGDDGEERERAALRTEEQGHTWLGTPRMLRMPFRDQHGLPVFLDVRRWIPSGDVFDTTQGSMALPIPAPLQFGGPLMLAFELLLNRQAFTGEDITDDLTMDNSDKVSAVADWAWKAWAPGSFWTPYSWYWTKIGNALYGATDTAGRPYSVPQAFLSAIGIKVKPIDVEDGINWHFYDFKKTQTALTKKLRSNAYRLERGLVSQKAHDAEAARLMERFSNMETELGEFEKRIEPRGR
jgi:hypothetical protein